MKNISDKILSRITRKGRGWVFTPKDFLDIGSRAAVDQTLSRLSRTGKIRRLRRGIYDFPKTSPLLGVLAPSPDALAKTVARSRGISIHPSGAQAANALGISTQVPARPVYFTTGPSQKIPMPLGRGTIVLKHISSRFILNDNGATLVLMTMRYLGRTGVHADTVRKIADTLPTSSKTALGNAVGKVPDWMAQHIKTISGARAA